MKTEQTDLRNEIEYQSKRKVFKQVFILLMKLTAYKSVNYQTEVDAVIQAIDDLMEVMIEY